MRSVPAQRAPSHAKILLVDDNKDGTMARRSVLEELGYQVVSTTSGPDALTLAIDTNFDLIVTDFKMAPLNGLELIARLRAQNFSQPIILLTGFAESVGLRPETTGADAVIQKNANEVSTLVRHTKRLLSVPRKPVGSHNHSSAASARRKE